MENLLIKTFHYYEELEGEVFIFGTCRPNKKRVFFFFGLGSGVRENLD